jgi:Phage derived protein Gp49-like (DUF891)
MKRVPAIFYRTEAGNEPVREWLKAMSVEDRRRIGEDLKSVEFGWPLGMPVCRSLGGGLHEVRTDRRQPDGTRLLLHRSAAAPYRSAWRRQEDEEDPGSGPGAGAGQQEQA